MKNGKNKFTIGTTIFLIFFIVTISYPQQMTSIEALVNENNKISIDSCEIIAWSWGETEVISTESADDSYSPSIATDSAGNVYVAWDDTTDYAGSDSDTDVFYKRWDASSSAWTATEVVSTESTDDSDFSSIAVDSIGNVHIAWEDRTNYTNCGTDLDIFYKYWNITSSSWSITEVISTESTENSRTPWIAIDPAGNVHIVWYDKTNYLSCGTDSDIFYKYLNISTYLWSTLEVVSSESTDDSSIPSLDIDSAGNVHIAWDDRTNYTNCGTDKDIFYKRWDNQTSSWSSLEIVSSESSSTSWYPSLTVDSSGNVHITWMDQTDYANSGTENDIFYKRLDTSSSWSTTEVVSTASTNDAFAPRIAADPAGNVHIAWWDSSNILGSGTNPDVFYKRWDTSIFAWTSTELVSIVSTEYSNEMAIATDPAGNVHIAWYGNTNYTNCGTDYDIFYRVLTSPLVAPELAFIVPNPTDVDTVYLDWNNISEAASYFVYRSDYYIWSVENLVPVNEVVDSYYIDTLPSEGYFYYVIVASNFAGNSSHSNCQYVEYKLPHVREFSIITGLILGTIIIALIVMRTRKNKLE